MYNINNGHRKKTYLKTFPTLAGLGNLDLKNISILKGEKAKL